MKNYVLLTESGSDLSSEMANEYGIKVIPMVLQLDGKTYADGDISAEEMFDYCDKHGVYPTTSAPSPADFEAMYRKIRSETPDSIIIHIGYSAQTTVSYQNAITADKAFENIYHVDSEQVSAGLGAVAIRTARYLRANPDVEPSELLGQIKKFGQKMNFHFVVQDMHYLRAGGRCSNVQFLLGQILGIKPVIEMKNGLLVATRRLRGKMERVYENVVDHLLSAADIDTDEIYLIFTSGLSKEVCEKIEEKCRRDYHVNRVVWSRTGCIISTHSGPGGFGIGAMSKG